MKWSSESGASEPYSCDASTPTGSMSAKAQTVPGYRDAVNASWHQKHIEQCQATEDGLA
jgi:hypothetical protein